MAGKYGAQRGRKECVHEVRTKLRTHKVEIRFDRHEGDFFADLNGQEFKDPSIKELEAILRKEASKADNIAWETWIVYTLINTEHHYGGRRKYQDLSDPVVGIKFKCVDIAVKQEGVSPRERRRRVDEDGIIEDISSNDLGQVAYLDMDQKRIKFTPDRWVALKGVQSVIADARKKLGLLLDADERSDVEDRLDSMTTPLLMTGSKVDE
jgi:hypothetical protein